MKTSDTLRAFAIAIVMAMALQRPWVVPFFLLCLLLPVWLGYLLAAWRSAADITLALDPCDAAPSTILEAFRTASELAATSGQPATLAIAPLYDSASQPLPLAIDLTPSRDIEFRVANRHTLLPNALTWLPRHPLPLVTEQTPLMLLFELQPDKRLTTRLVTPLPMPVQIWSHTAMILLLLPFSGPAATSAAAAAVCAIFLRHRRHDC